MEWKHFFLLLVYFDSFWCQDNAVNYYKEVINSQIKESLTYEYPKDASSFRATEENKLNDFGVFDFIIIGAGASGTVVANRLSEIGIWKVLLLDAGEFGNNATEIPNMETSVKLSSYDWGYKSVPQTTCCLDMVNQQCQYPRGRGIGGTTLINGLVYSRGNKIDYDKFANYGISGWSYNEVLPFFRLSENFVKTDPDVKVDWKDHGEGGYLNVEYSIPRHPMLTRWLDANKEKGYQVVDYNNGRQQGVAIAQINTRHGRREDGGSAFIKPVKCRDNLTILTGSYVVKIVVSENKTVEGVRYVRGKKNYFVKCRKEVILSAGSIESPHLLMLSGIGPAEHLEKFGIQTIQDLQVGTKLRDHPTFYGLYYDSNYTKTHEELGSYIKEYLRGEGSLTVPNYNGGMGFYTSKLEKTKNYPDIEMMMMPVDGFSDTLQQQLGQAKEKTWQHLNQSRSFLTYIIGLHSKSHGTIRLKSNDPFDYPLIDSRFLSDPGNHDIAMLYEGIKIALSIVDTAAFKRINASLVKQDLPGCKNETYLSKEYWYCVLRFFTGNVYHPFGTCPMGGDPKKGAVVDGEGKVHGIENLRVVDASVIPGSFSGHPNAICVMMGEKISYSIKKQHLKVNMMLKN